jgi:DNA topoisomerase-1
MANTLVIVESPAKARTIKKVLGPSYEVLASNGHVKDLPKKKGVDVDNGFKETYEIIDGKTKVVAKLKSAAKKADEILIATDPDREGEAIAFHIAEEIAGRRPVRRVEFHEITRRGIESGVANPRELDAHLYDAQRARRVLDRIVGYDVSALVWSKLAFGLSAGRVQSVALRLIVDREREIEAFEPEEYWNISVGLRGESGAAFTAKLAGADGEKIAVHDGETAAEVRADLESAAYEISKITKREQRRRPPAPYTTSKLQQDASNVLHMPAKRTMRTAQQLYEGIDLKRDGGPVGLITYIRTDSTRVAGEAIASVRDTIARTFGPASLPDKPNVYKSKKGAQDAHEAIRPTDVALVPDGIKKYLKKDQYRLYKLIYQRFVASQMTPAVYDRTAYDIAGTTKRKGPLHETYRVRANGRVLKSPGWLQVLGEGVWLAGEGEGDAPGNGAAANGGNGAGLDDVTRGTIPPPGPAAPSADALAALGDDKSEMLPELDEGAELEICAPPGVVTEQKFTQPPPRYNEGSLVRELERRGIGRPSTYAEIIGKVQARAYVNKLDGGGFQPTELGRFVVDGLVLSELDFMDPGFTAQMEEELDEVGAGKLKRVALLKKFYKRFSKQLAASKKKPAWKPDPIETDEACEECGSPLLKRWSKNGWFLGCTAYPKCKFTRDAGDEGGARSRETDITCDKCGKPMVIKTGRYGEFLSCSGYPKCKNARPIPLGVPCPECGGDLIEIRPRKRGGRTFYGCSNYQAEQKCEFKLWSRPIPIPCPQCGAPFMTQTKGRKPMQVCANKECKFKREAPDEEAANGGKPS